MFPVFLCPLLAAPIQFKLRVSRVRPVLCVFMNWIGVPRANKVLFRENWQLYCRRQGVAGNDDLSLDLAVTIFEYTRQNNPLNRESSVHRILVKGYELKTTRPLT